VAGRRPARPAQHGMRRSTDRILTTHVGSLPTLAPVEAATQGAATLRQSVDAVVRKQREIGLDVINEGEYTKGGDWLSFVESRFSGFEERPRPPDELPLVARGTDPIAATLLGVRRPGRVHRPGRARA
jgi:5-methyltetrahydropteroyltriglutamate--homocysteine methyltransferase